MTPTQLRAYAPPDAAAVLALNAANVPEVGPMDDRKLELLARGPARFSVATAGDEIVGFAILLAEDADYASPNYRWFVERHPRFLYVDRIAIAADARGDGLGRRIYEGALELARATERPVLCAEVNTIPPNPGSMRFHARFGFREVARTRPYDAESEVAMLERAVD